ncbi:DciA family protein [Borrelia sp. P9F1]|uniref:DciA family protein n=1 Tax=Borrelia sp. P9F1 TaxID=3058374 RepID=UPI00264938CE|nr:DciA family protein [Borrelia sp. P9F1]WKC57993.1 DciA family protein [Borrelia sp. P9F1]
MEDLNFKKASDVLNKYLRSDIVPNKNLNASLVLSQNWKIIFGELADGIKLLDLKDNKVLYIGVKNSSVLYNISMRKSKIIKLIKESTGVEVVDITVLIR